MSIFNKILISHIFLSHYSYDDLQKYVIFIFIENIILYYGGIFHEQRYSKMV